VSFSKNIVKCGGFLPRKRKVVVFGKFELKSGGFMLLTLSNIITSMGDVLVVHIIMHGSFK
jgi:hypothetical protein